MNTKYDWSNVPDNVTWISTDWEGWKLYHTSKPVKKNLDFSSESDDLGCFEMFSENEYVSDWEDSLEERPKLVEERPKRLELTQEFIDLVNNVCGIDFELSNRKQDTNILSKGVGYICILNNEVNFQLNFNGVYIDDVIDVNITEEGLITFLNEKVQDAVERLNNKVGNILTMQKQWLNKLGGE